MWQRIQTLYLGLATLMTASLFGCDVARYAAAGGATATVPFTGNTVYLVFIIILTILQTLALGGFKWRIRQFRVTLFTAFTSLGFQGWLVYDYFKFSPSISFLWTALIPLAAAVLDFLAARAIMMDEAIVQSAGRLRKARKKH